MVQIRELINTSILNSEWVGFNGDSEFIDDWENDDLFPTSCQYVKDTGKTVTRHKYRIELG